MKRKWIIAIVIFLLAGLVTAWLVRPGRPVICFVEYRPGSEQNSRVAVFRITNQTRSPYTVPEDDWLKVTCLLSTRVSKRLALAEVAHCSVQGQTIAPGSSVEFTVPTPKRVVNAPFEVGVRFERGTAEEVAARRRSEFSELRTWMRRRLKIPHWSDDLTWSDTAPRH